MDNEVTFPKMLTQETVERGMRKAKSDTTWEEVSATGVPEDDEPQKPTRALLQRRRRRQRLGAIHDYSYSATGRAAAAAVSLFVGGHQVTGAFNSSEERARDRLRSDEWAAPSFFPDGSLGGVARLVGLASDASARLDSALASLVAAIGDPPQRALEDGAVHIKYRALDLSVLCAFVAVCLFASAFCAVPVSTAEYAVVAVPAAGQTIANKIMKKGVSVVPAMPTIFLSFLSGSVLTLDSPVISALFFGL
eukprot:TRINITY_DN17333_c1_g3_i1.p1 TRINITY_DN17333_c1_g3~~TRINITY_DN17333_c1_g3_i1.p1  ORF type:complete len:284 (+),score=49.96 TRINITY_DN17333_c1_g3_i1:103-852(+)